MDGQKNIMILKEILKITRGKRTTFEKYFKMKIAFSPEQSRKYKHVVFNMQF